MEIRSDTHPGKGPTVSGVLVAAGVGLTGHQHRPDLGLRTMSESIEDGAYHPVRRQHTQAQRSDDCGKEHYCRYKRVQGSARLICR